MSEEKKLNGTVIVTYLLHGYAPHRIFQMHYKVLRKRKSLPLQVPLMSR